MPVHDYLVPIANYQGGDYPMQGSSGSSEIEFAFDPVMANIHDSEGQVLPDGKPEQAGQERTGKRKDASIFSIYDYRENALSPKVYVYQGHRRQGDQERRKHVQH